MKESLKSQVTTVLLMTIFLSGVDINEGIADEIYKTVDAQGNVVYSTEPPAGGQTSKILETLPEPSAEDIQAARERQKKLEEDLEKLARANEEKSRQYESYQQNTPTTVIYANPPVVPLYVPRQYWRGRDFHDSRRHRVKPYSHSQQLQ